MVSTQPADRPTPATPRQLARKYATRLEQLKNDFISRDEAINVIGLATLCREHVLLVGPPGTAKTALLTSFGRLLDTNPFTYLLTRFTEPTELFGPLDVQRFQRESVYHVNTTGMLPQAHLAFLDEVFEGSSAILNALLTLINERIFYNGSTPEPSNLITLLGSTNDVPDDPVLAALSDRFLIRCRLDYVADDEVEDVLDLGWRSEQQLITTGLDLAPRPSPILGPGRTQVRFSLDDLAVLQQAVATIDLSPIRAPYAEIVRELRAQGVAFSDRRAVKAQKVFAAAALLAGRTEADLADLGVLGYLWTDRRDEPTLRRILTEHGVSVTDPGRRVRDLTEIRVDLRELQARLRQPAVKEEHRELLRRLQQLVTELRREHPGATELLTELTRTQREAMGAFRERFPDVLDDPRKGERDV